MWLAMALGVALGIAAALLGWALGIRGMTLIGVGLSMPLAMPVCAFVDWRKDRGLWMLAIVIVPLYLVMATMGFADLFRHDVRPSGQVVSVLGSIWVLICAAATLLLAHANWARHRRGGDGRSPGGPSARRTPLSPPPHLLGALASEGHPGQQSGRSARVR